MHTQGDGPQFLCVCVQRYLLRHTPPPHNTARGPVPSLYLGKGRREVSEELGLLRW
ncbi:hypothetical protein E2C01_094816 [Portunus trituberculatus]|uniref:Uncharacterized protein n=1 Tax=Portunus trituberculatus TaxID=210409 RepID=A0A5B7JY78_PORTR|nr:hypothetical protein [Portunus trituberculatus]